MSTRYIYISIRKWIRNHDLEDTVWEYEGAKTEVHDDHRSVDIKFINGRYQVYVYLRYDPLERWYSIDEDSTVVRDQVLKFLNNVSDEEEILNSYFKL